MKKYPESQTSSREKIILIGLTAFIAFCLLLLGLQARFQLFDITPTPEEFCCIDGSADANVFTWLDLDGDGKRDDGEPQLLNIAAILWEGDFYPPPDMFADIHLSARTNSYLGEGRRLTDGNGQASLSIFMPGCAENCSEGYWVAVEVPDGYIPTTPTFVPVENDLSKVYEFGFQKSP